ncbi:metal-dependent transcriptional regulator [Chloroflexota bacterium]
MSQRTIEEYVESIGALEEMESPVSTSSIAQMLGVSLASVSEMLRRLDEKGLVEYTPYGGASLTKEGKQHYFRLTRRHRLWEVFLNRHLGIGWEDVYHHACSLEHATSDLVAERLAEFLGNPEVCPHGSAIPEGNLKQRELPGVSLADLAMGQTAEVVRIISEADIDFLHYLSDLDLKPGARIKVRERASFDGTLTVEIDNSTRALGAQAAALIMVRPV